VLPDYGIDACGANLFCAAFDGRTQPTCYPERSRLDLQSCDEDRHCASGSCSPMAKKCQSLPGMTCDPMVGCARAPTGEKYGCDAKTLRCGRVGDGAAGAFCVDGADCKSGTCKDQGCQSPAGGACQQPTDCSIGVCRLCQQAGVFCSNPGDPGECLLKCWNGDYRPVCGSGPPQAPSLSCYRSFDGHVTLAWSLASSGPMATSITFDRDDGAGFSLFTSVTPTSPPSVWGAMSFDDDTTAAGHKYRYRMRASNPDGNSADSTVCEATP
jgi:hypothetical protein